MKKRYFAKKGFAIAAAVCLLPLTGAHTVLADALEAERIALEDAGLSGAEELRLYTDHSAWEGEYEIEFYADEIEYEYTIREENNEILEWKMEGRNINDAVAEKTLPEDQKDYIGLEKAKEIVLKDAGLSQEEAVFTTIQFDKGRRRDEYELELSADRREYEYTLDAATGEILEYDRD